VVSIVVSVPFTSKSPVIVASPFTVRLSPIVTSDVECPIFTAIPLLAVPKDIVPVDVSILVFPATSKENVDVPSIVIALLASISSVEESMSMATSAATPISIPPAPSIDTLPLFVESMSTPVCPSNTKLPASESIVRLPADAFIVPASVRVISPSKNKSCQAWVAEPKS